MVESPLGVPSRYGGVNRIALNAPHAASGPNRSPRTTATAWDTLFARTFASAHRAASAAMSTATTLAPLCAATTA